MSQYESPELKRALKEFSGDYRIMRVVMSSDNPIGTLQNIRSGRYSVRTFLDVLEMLDFKSTLEEQEILRARQNNNQ